MPEILVNPPSWLVSVLQMVAVVAIFGAISLALIAWERRATRKKQARLAWTPPKRCKCCPQDFLNENVRMRYEWAAPVKYKKFVRHHYQCLRCNMTLYSDEPREGKA